MTNHSAQYFVNRGFLKFLEDQATQNVSEKEIAEKLFDGYAITPEIASLRQITAIAKSQMREEEVNMVKGRRLAYMSVSDIAKEVEISEERVLKILKNEGIR